MQSTHSFTLLIDFATTQGGVRIPEGSAINLPLAHITANDPRWAGASGDMDPAVFNPERMLSREGRKKGDLMPFGHAGRHCLGVHLVSNDAACLPACLLFSVRVIA